MDKIIITPEDGAALYAWRDGHKDAVRAYRAFSSDVKILSPDEDGNIISVIRCTEKENGLLVRFNVAMRGKIFARFIWHRAPMTVKHEIEPQIKPDEINSVIGLYCTIMAYVNQPEIIQAERSIFGNRERLQHIRKTNNAAKPQPPRVVEIKHIRKIYDERAHSGDSPRPYQKPDDRVHVRGFWRHYRSGKVSWIEAHDTYTDKPETAYSKTYKLEL